MLTLTWTLDQMRSAVAFDLIGIVENITCSGEHSLSYDAVYKITDNIEMDGKTLQQASRGDFSGLGNGVVIRLFRYFKDI